MISDGKIITQSETAPLTETDLTSLFISFTEQYRNVFIANVGEQVFIYRSLGRSEYKEIIQNEALDDFTREDVICDVCTLFPENYDFSKCAAGIPGKLTKEILRNSLLDKLSARRDVLLYYRQEMYSMDEQISCLIHEAFPRFDIEEIESWDVEKTTKYLSRAEWILQNLRGVPFNDYIDLFTDEDEDEDIDALPESDEPSPMEQVKVAGKRKLSPEEQKQLEELKRKIPEIDWDNDAVMTGRVMSESVNTISPALRTPDMMPDGVR